MGELEPELVDNLILADDAVDRGLLQIGGPRWDEDVTVEGPEGMLCREPPVWTGTWSTLASSIMVAEGGLDIFGRRIRRRGALARGFIPWPTSILSRDDCHTGDSEQAGESGVRRAVRTRPARSMIEVPPASRSDSEGR